MSEGKARADDLDTVEEDGAVTVLRVDDRPVAAEVQAYLARWPSVKRPTDAELEQATIWLLSPATKL